MLPRLASPCAPPPPPPARGTNYFKLHDGQPALVADASSSSSYHQPVKDAHEVFAQVGADTDADMGGWKWQEEAQFDLDQCAAIGKAEQESVVQDKSAMAAVDEAGKPDGEFAKAGGETAAVPWSVTTKQQGPSCC
jgi:hypothetical protein